MSILSIDKNTVLIVDGVNSRGSEDLLDHQEVTVFGSGISISSGTDVTYGGYLNITFSGSGYIEKALTDATTSLTVDCRAHSAGSIVTATVYDPTQTTVLSKRKIGHTAFPQKIAMEFSSGIGQTLRLEGSNAGIHLYHVYADTGLRVNYVYKYLGFYTTDVRDWPTLMELHINYEGGSISKDSTEELGNTINDTIGTTFNYGYGIVKYNSIDGTLSKMFDGISNQYANGARYTFTNAGANRFYFYLELETPISNVTDFTYWSGGAGGELDRYAFMDLHIYGTNTDPLTMGTNGSDMNNLSNWTLLSTNFTKKPYSTYSYP